MGGANRCGTQSENLDWPKLGQIIAYFTMRARSSSRPRFIVPFLYGGVVKVCGLTDRQFVDAVAVAMITPGPVVITTGFIALTSALLGRGCRSSGDFSALLPAHRDPGAVALSEHGKHPRRDRVSFMALPPLPWAPSLEPWWCLGKHCR